MRLIDADELKKNITKFAILPYKYWKAVMSFINNAPTISFLEDMQEIEERPTAEWIMHTDEHYFTEWICTNCGKHGRGDYKFCPWCAAKMKGGCTE